VQLDERVEVATPSSSQYGYSIDNRAGFDLSPGVPRSPEERFAGSRSTSTFSSVPMNANRAV
jgi:hypothetical protein